MTAENLNTILNKIAQNQHTEADLLILRQAIDSGDLQTKTELAKYIVNLREGKEIHIGDRVFHVGTDAKSIAETINKILVFCTLTSSMTGFWLGSNTETVARVLKLLISFLMPDIPMPEEIIETLTSFMRSGAVVSSTKMWNVPPVPELFVGRENALQEFKEILGIIQDDETRITKTCAISGWPGVGKTTFASALANDPDLLNTFPDGIFWTTFDQRPDVLSKLVQWGKWLGDSNVLGATTVQECVLNLAMVLRDKRVLLIVDDVWSVHDVANFYQIVGEGSTLLFTTRLPEVADLIVPSPKHRYRLPVLTDEDALALLFALAPEVVKAQPEACRELVADLEGLPLALHVAGRLLCAEARMGWGVTDLLKELRAGAKLLEQSAPPDLADLASQTIPTVAVLLDKSTRLLRSEIRDRFAMLGVMAPKPATFDLSLMETLWQVEDPKPTVTQLVQRGLLEPLNSGRFQMHALLVTHAQSLLEED